MNIYKFYWPFSQLTFVDVTAGKPETGTPESKLVVTNVISYTCDVSATCQNTCHKIRLLNLCARDKVWTALNTPRRR